jgi:hypothetical protein
LLKLEEEKMNKKSQHVQFMLGAPRAPRHSLLSKSTLREAASSTSRRKIYGNIFSLFISSFAGQDAVHITAILGESVIFNCHVEFPGDHPVPYVLQWEKKVSETV